MSRSQESGNYARLALSQNIEELAGILRIYRLL
jgi:hypothetical protein